MTVNRRPAGTSIGGQWAEGSAAEIDLGDEDYSEVPQEGKAVRYLDSRDFHESASLEHRAHRRMISSAAREMHERFPGAAYAVFREDHDNPDAVMFEGVYDSDGRIIAELGERDPQGHVVNFGAAASDIESFAEWGRLNQELDSTQALDAFPSDGEEDFIEYGSNRVAIDIHRDKNSPVPPRENFAAPGDPFTEEMEGLGARSWRPRLSEDQKSYRMDTVDVIRARDGKVFEAPVMSAEQAEAVIFFENRARADRDFPD